ncbi:MAG: hypothetical protein M1837_003217 [Sclerophora amabilis]|nr:MAG: hypothetical protein M1837_003217 [Sclerophora amabilis]
MDGGCDTPTSDANSKVSEFVDQKSVLLPLPLNPSKSNSYDNNNTSVESPTPAKGVVVSSTSLHKKTASTNSTGTYSTPSRNGFRNITRSMLNASPSDPSGMLGDFTPLDPAKFSPGGSADSPIDVTRTYHSYASVSKSNPFADERSTQWPSLDEYSKLPPVPTYHTNVPKGMSQSRSENNLTSRAKRPPSPIDTSRPYRGRTALDRRAILPDRGRSTSPVKYLKDLKEDEESDFAHSPTKRSRSPMKKMFGENGWLGRSTSMKELPDEQYKKSGLKHWGSKVKQRVEGLTEDMTRMIPNPFNHEAASKEPLKSKFPVSLDPPAQAKLYSEVELMICVTANTYLMQQHRLGRMSVESVYKILDFWKSKGRPQVIEFQFDQATQRDLILHNIKSFRFYGPNAENSLALNSMLYGWKALAKEMNVRTFCTPDSAIKKHLHDIYKILELLGAPLTTFLAFQEVQVNGLRIMREEQERREERAQLRPGVERAWIPPSEIPAHARRSEKTDSSGRLSGMFHG